MISDCPPFVLIDKHVIPAGYFGPLEQDVYAESATPATRNNVHVVCGILLFVFAFRVEEDSNSGSGRM